MRQEQFVLVFRRNAFAGIGNGNFNSIGFRAQLRGYDDFAERFAFESFGGVVDQVDDDAAEELAVGANRGKVRLEVKLEMDAVEAAGEELQCFANGGVGVGWEELGCGEANELGKFVNERGERGDFTHNEAGAFLGDAGEFRVLRKFVSLLAALEEKRQALRGKLDGREGIFDFVGDAAGNFLPGGGFLRVEHFGEVVEDENVAHVGAAGAEGADGGGEVADAAVYDDFDFAGDDAHAKGAAHEGLHRAMRVWAEQGFERLDAFLGDIEHAEECGVGALDCAFGVQIDDAGGNIFENGFHELAAAFKFLHGLLEVACELVNLRAAVTQLRGHGVEGADEDAEFVLHLFGNLIIEISGGDFARAFRKGLDGDGDLLGEEHSDPHGGGENQKSEEEKNEQHLPLQSAQILLHVFVIRGLSLNDVPALEEIGARAIGGDEHSLLGPVESDRNMGGEITFIFGLPDFDAAGQSVLQSALFAADAADVVGAVFLLVVANHAAFDELAFGVEHPGSVETGGKGVFEKDFRSFTGVLRGLIAQGVEARKHAVAEIVQELLRFFRGDFERPGEPATEGAVEQGIAHKKHEYDGEKRDGGCAENHLGFETGAEVVLASLGPQADDAPRENQAENEQGGGDEAGDRIESDNFAPGLRFERNVQRAESENGGEQEGDKDTAQGELNAQLGGGGAHWAPSGGCGKKGR